MIPYLKFGSKACYPLDLCMTWLKHQPSCSQPQRQIICRNDKSRKRRRDDQGPPPPPPDSDLSKKKRHDSDASGSSLPPAPQSSAWKTTDTRETPS
nr:hypothetical protein [Tanacetum cinerariifolium]